MKKYLSILLISILISGCVIQSLNKFYTDETKVNLDQINGEWIPEKLIGKDVKDKKLTPWKFASDHIETYDGDNIHSKLDCVYFKVGNYYFIDFTAGEPNFKTNSYWGAGVILVHSLCRVIFDNDTLVITPLNYEWVKEMVKNNRLKLSFVRSDSGDYDMIFTASSKEWVEFLRNYGANSEAFSEKQNCAFKRKK